MPVLDINITIEEIKWTESFQDIEKYTNDIIKKIIDQLIESIPHIEISIVLANNDFIQVLNKKYRKQDKPTNILSFPQTEYDVLIAPAPFLGLGDIIIAYETIKEEAKDQNKSFKDHFTHMLVHGCLHLLHYDHQTDEEAEEMEMIEISILNNLEIKNPYELT